MPCTSWVSRTVTEGVPGAAGGVAVEGVAGGGVTGEGVAGEGAPEEGVSGEGVGGAAEGVPEGSVCVVWAAAPKTASTAVRRTMANLMRINSLRLIPR
jgi:hypothetical protein